MLHNCAALLPYADQLLSLSFACHELPRLDAFSSLIHLKLSMGRTGGMLRHLPPSLTVAAISLNDSCTDLSFLSRLTGLSVLRLQGVRQVGRGKRPVPPPVNAWRALMCLLIHRHPHASFPSHISPCRLVPPAFP